MRRKIVILYTLLVFVASFVGTFLVLQRMPTHTLAASTDWTMYQGDLGRSGFNSAETILNRSTAPRLMVHWKYHAGGAINTQPVVVNGRIYWGAWDGNEYAMDLNGNVLWKTYLGQTIGCKNQATGVASTATIASVSIKGIPTAVDFVGGGNGRFYALDAVHGTILWSTPLGASPHLMIWDAPAVYNGSVYIGVSSYGDCPLVQGQLIQLDASTGQVQHTFNVVPNGCIGGGIWAAPTVDTAAQTLYFTTGTRGIGCPTYETLSLALLEVRATDLTLVGSWQVPASQQISDGDFGTTPTLFKATIAGVVHQLVGAVNKNGIYYAFDRSNISRGPLWQHQIATGSFRISPSGWDGATLYAANATTTIAGHGCAGSVRALNPATGASVWESCVPGGVLGAVTLVPGLVIVGAGSSLVVLDTTTGQRLFLYTDPTIGSDFWGAASVSNGMLYMGNKDGNLYAFGVSGTPVPPPPAPSSTPATGKAPVSKTWYFAEGKVGQGFTEFLTIENPGAVSCAVTIQYLLGSGGPVTVPVTVPPFSRYTESVNSDLHLAASSSAYQTDAARVSVTTANCTGVVAERPMYFTNFKGVSSGTDVLGATHTGSDYYFADVSSLPSYHSYITILNPPGGAIANLTATYYRGGTVLGTDTLAVPAGTRGTIIPKSFGQRVATWVHASAPVVVERPTYFNNYFTGNVHNVSGAASVVGAPAPATDWRFAEGYTGGGFQENLLLANFGTSAASGKVVLEYDNGSTLTNTVSVPAHDALSFDVNNATATKQGTCAPTPCVLSQSVSAEITVSSGAIAAEREMFFQYNHLDRLTGRTVTAQGGSDVTGQAGAARLTAYSFAEGYSNQGYDEWLTVQNPTASSETIAVILVNGDGHNTTQQYPVGAHTRLTIDIGALVSQHLIQPGDTFRGYEVSMTVQSTSGVFVAERPMYWDTGSSGTQGGSDVIGYMGN